MPAAETPQRLVQRVARRIEERRRETGLTQEQLAERLDVSVQYVSKIETGANLTLTSLADIARALETTADALFVHPAPTPRSPGRGRPRKPS